MKTRYVTVMLLILMLFTGCFKQDYSLCVVEENCVLLFELEEATRSTGFSSTITSVNVALFDKDGNLVTRERVDKGQLDAFQGVRLTVTPGLYYAVAWGNVTNSVELSTVNGTCFGESYLKVTSDESGCGNLYYAPAKEIGIVNSVAGYTPDYSLYEVNVKANEVTRKTLLFTRASRSVSVYIKGFDECTDVLLADAPDQYDYYLRTHSTRKDYSQKHGRVVYKPTGELLDAASYRIPITPFDEAVNINLLDESLAADNILYSLNLKQWLKENESKIKDPLKIDILISRYVNGTVSAEVVNWSDSQVDPIW